MKTLAKYEVNIPEWALPYLINGDDGNLSLADKAEIENYMDEFHREASGQDAHVLLTTADDEPSFTFKPAFGLACNTVRCFILILK